MKLDEWRNELITKGAAFDALTEVESHYEFEDGHDHLMSWAKTKIFALPSAQPQWIPVTERLPEEDTEVLISYRYKEGEGDTDHVNIDITSYGTTCFGGREIHTLKEWRQPFDYFHANYEVIAWMPLPESYKGEKE